MQDFKVKIQTTADTAGAKATESALQGVGKAARDVTRETKAQGAAASDAARQVGSLGETTEKGIGLGRMFSEVARGNYLALLNLSTALKGLGAVMKTNALGAFALVVTTIGSIWTNLRDTKKAAEDAEPSFDELAASVAKLNQVKLDTLKAELEALNDEARASAEFFNKINAAAGKIDKAREQLELAKIEADDSLSPEQKKAAAYEVRQRFSRAAAGREAEAEQARIDRAQRDAEEKARLARQADDEREGVAGRVSATVDRRANLNQAMVQLNKQFRQGITTYRGDQAKQLALRQAYDQVADPLSEQQGAAFGPAADARLKAMRDELRGAEERARLSREAAAKAERELMTARGDASLGATTRATVGGLEAAAARVQAGLPAPVSRTGSTSEIVGGEMSVRGLNGEAVGNRIADLVAERIRSGEEAIVKAFQRRLQQDRETMQRLAEQIANGREGK